MSSQINLSPRLQTMANLVPQDSLFADIGTDHGYLPLFLLQKGQITQAIASDLNKGPLDRAKSLSIQYQIPLDLRLCDGLSGISPDEVNTISIAGMGGITMTHILQDWICKYPSVQQNWTGTFLLQPMSTQYDLRFWLTNAGFTIHQEKTTQEGETLYTILSVIVGKTHKSYTEAELWVGRHSETHPDPLRGALLDLWIEKTSRALSQVPPEQEKRRLELESRKNAFIRMKDVL